MAQRAHPLRELTISMAPGAHAHAPLEHQRGAPPPNDQCTGANIVVLPAGGTVQVSGDNTGSTDTENFGNPNCWEAFTIDTCSSVTVSYCGTAPVFGLVYSILLIGCPEADVSVQNSGIADCGDGNSSVTYENLAPGTYYVPVLLWPGQSEGPYTISFTSTPCADPPANDRCVDAQQVQVVEDCANGTVIGNNSLAQQQGAGPFCATTSTQFQDVWYTFNSGSNDQVMITIGIGSITDLGVEVRNACGGSLVVCGTGDTSYVANVDHNINYKVRVFSNNDNGVGGSFSICVRTAPPVDPCDGGHVSLANGDTTLTICNNEPPLDIFVSTTATVNYSLFLTNANDTIMEELGGSVLDPSGLLPGNYKVYGISHLTTLINATPGMPIDSVRSIGVCAERSGNHVEIIKDICQGMEERPAFWWLSTNDLSMRWSGTSGRVEVTLIDAVGRIVHRSERWMMRGERMDLTIANTLNRGLFVVQTRSGENLTVQKLLLR